MYHHHSLGGRFVAYFVDSFIIGIISTFIMSLGVGDVVEGFWGATRMLNFWQNLLLYIVYFVGFAIFNKGITFGKMLLNLKVTSSGYEELDQNRIIVREIIKSFLMPISFISGVIVFIREDRKSLHDMIMNTFVVREMKKVEDPYDLRPDRNVNKRKEYVDPLDNYYEGLDDENTESKKNNNDDDYYY